MDAGEVLFRKFAENMSWRHLKKKVAAKFLEDGCGIAPADAMRNAIYQVVSDRFLRVHGVSGYIPDVGHFWSS